MFLNSTILLIYLCWSQSISKMSSPYGPKAASLYSCPCVPISSNLSKLRAISIEHLFVCPCGSINIEQASSIVCPCGLSRTKNCSSAAGVDLWWSAIHIAKRFWATRRSGFLFFPEGRRPRWEVDPPLRVREDWWVFEDSLRFKGGLVGFRRSLKVQGSIFSFSKVQEITFIFSKAFFKPYFLKKTAYF